MSEHRIHPIYVVRDPHDVGCGHQHSHREQAENCANSILHRDPLMSHARIIKVRMRQKDTDPSFKTVATIEQTPLAQRSALFSKWASKQRKK